MSVTDIVIVLIIGLSLFLAVRKIVRDRKRGAPCSGCSGCSLAERCHSSQSS